MRSYWVDVAVKFDSGEQQKFLTGCRARDLNDAWTQCAGRYTGVGSVWYPKAQLVSLRITPEDMKERA